MKKSILILMLALIVALPLFGLTAETVTPPETDTQTVTPAPAPMGGMFGRRWNQAPAQTTPPAGFADENKDGICDNCGQEPGKNTECPNFVDADGNGVCDRFGTDEQGQGMARMQGRRHFGRGMRPQGLRQAQGRGMQGNVQGRGMQGRNFLDANNDGVCDNYNSNTQRNFGCGRNRR